MKSVTVLMMLAATRCVPWSRHFWGVKDGVQASETGLFFIIVVSKLPCTKIGTGRQGRW